MASCRLVLGAATNKNSMSRRLPSLAELHQDLSRLHNEVQGLATRKPHIEGTDKLYRSMKGKVVSPAANTETSRDEGRADNGILTATLSEDDMAKHIQGAVNNIQGVRAELLAADLFPGVTAVSKRFHSKPEDGKVYDSAHAEAGSAAGGGGRRGLSVEIDVVAQHGAWWVEVKSHEAFGTSSTHWLGYRGHTKGLKEQAGERMAVAAAPCNAIRWQRPQLIFFFPEGVNSEVACELKSMGAFVVDGRQPFAPQLPPAPPPIRYANLDVTTMCAMVSEVSNGGAAGGGTPEVLAWAARISHWVDSVAAEAEDPILPALNAVFEGRQLIASQTAVTHFEKLLAMCGGAREKQRWENLRRSIIVVRPPHEQAATAGALEVAEAGEAAPGSKGSSEGVESAAHTSSCRAHIASGSHSAAPGGTEPPQLEPGTTISGWHMQTHPEQRQQQFFSARVARLQQMSEAQRWVLGLSDLVQAVTVTANGKMMKAASKQGVELESFVHRAMWLTGL